MTIGFIDVLDSVSDAFWCGWLGGSAIIAGGKAWTLLVNPHKKVTDLLGHIGTPGFRRELAVGVAVYTVARVCFSVLENKLQLTPDSLIEKMYAVITGGVSIAAGCVIATKITHSSYHYLSYLMIAVIVFRAARWCLHGNSVSSSG